MIRFLSWGRRDDRAGHYKQGEGGTGNVFRGGSELAAGLRQGVVESGILIFDFNHGDTLPVRLDGVFYVDGSLYIERDGQSKGQKGRKGLTWRS